MSADKSMLDNDFRRIAKQEIIKWWNTNTFMISEYGTINIGDICTIWQCLIDGNFKAFHQVTFNGGEYYFEFIYQKQHDKYVLNVYTKIDNVIPSYNLR